MSLDVELLLKAPGTAMLRTPNMQARYMCGGIGQQHLAEDRMRQV